MPNLRARASLLSGDRWKQLLIGETVDIVTAPWKGRKRSCFVSALYVYIACLFTLSPEFCSSSCFCTGIVQSFSFPRTLLLHKSPEMAEECKRKAAQEDPGIITEGKCLSFEHSESIDSRGVWVCDCWRLYSWLCFSALSVFSLHLFFLFV